MGIFSNLLDPTDVQKKDQGFKPNFLIRSLRHISKAIIYILKLDGRTRWSNEFIQALDPSISIDAPLLDDAKMNKKIWFRTGHGRLFWRTRHSFYSEPETNAWIKSFSKNDVFFDIGANIGFYSLLASKCIGTKVYAFEPDLMNSRLLYENIIKNNVSDLVTLIPVALSNKNYCAKLVLSTLSYGDALHNLDEKNSIISGEAEAEIKIPAFSLDTIVDLLGLEKPTKLKIDVDGIEYKILEGAKKTLEGTNEILVEWQLGSQEKNKILQILQMNDFKLQWETNPHTKYSNTVNSFFKK